MKTKSITHNAQRQRGTGIAIHAATAAFTPARAVTSHLRKRYRERYHGKHRYPRLVFAFDVLVLGLAAFLAGLNIYLFTILPAPIGDLRLVLRAPAIHTAEPLALEAVVSSISSSTHQGVRLVWQLPPGTEIISAEPALTASNEAVIGEVKPGESVSSRIVVRLFVPPDSVRFGFRLSDERGSVTGAETRRVEGSGLTFEPVIPVASVAPGAPIPYRLKNSTGLSIPSVNQEGDLAPYTERILFITPSATEATRLTATSNGIELVRREDPTAILTTDPTGARLSISPSGGHEARFSVDATRAISVAVFHPGLPHQDGHVRVYDVPVGHTDIAVPVEPSNNDEFREWFVIPSVRLSDGNALGNLVRAAITTAFDVSVAARYYAASGDQIGIGPLPPRVGEPTRYWVQVAIGPTSSDLADVRVVAKLGANVRVTGRDALPDGGSFIQAEDGLAWVIPFLPAQPQGVSASFEVELIPSETQKGTVPLLISSVNATATDQRARVIVQTSSKGVDANLPEDEKAKNLGTVR